MAEVLFTAPLFHKVHLSLPWTLFKLAEQISSDDGEIMTMNVTDPNESTLCVNVHRKTEAGEEKLIIEVTDPEGICEQGLVETDDESWRFNLGSVQSPVYLQRDNRTTSRTTSIQEELLIKTEVLTTDEKTMCKINDRMMDCDQLQGDQVINEEDKVMYISSDHLVQLLESGDLIMKSENEAIQGMKVPHVADDREVISNDSGLIQRDPFSCVNSGSDENTVSRDTDMLDVSQDSDEKSITQRLDINMTEGIGSESSHSSSMLPESVVVVEQQPEDSQHLTSVHSEHMDHFIILASGDIHDITDTATEMVQTCDAKWSVESPEVSGMGNNHITNLRRLGMKSSEVDVDLMAEPKQEVNCGKTMDLALGSSIMVQSVKDIPRIMVDVEAFKCPACVRRFYSLDVLQGHFQRLHRDHVFDEAEVEKVMVRNAYLCFICRHPFHRFDAVRKHLEAIHKLQMERRKITRQNVCPLCSSKHSSLRTLRCHLNYKHHDDPRYKETLVAVHAQICQEYKPKQDSRILLQCPFCLINLRFKQFIHHLRIAHQDDPSYDEILKQSKQAMKEQKRKKLHETSKECKYCHKEFPLTRFYSHLRNVHRTEQGDAYRCPVCGKIFHSNWHLNMHKLIHTEEKNQKCEICGRHFRHIYSLKKHKRTIHLKDYPFPCQVCGRGFHTRTLFRNHRCKPRTELKDIDKSAEDKANEEKTPRIEILTKIQTVDNNSSGVCASRSDLKCCGIATVAIPTPKDILSLPASNTSLAVRALALKSVTAQNTLESTEGAVNQSSVGCTAAADEVDSSHLREALVQTRLETERATSQNEPSNRSGASCHLDSQIIDSQDKYRHLDVATGSQVCNICEKQFKNLMSISAHLRRVHHISRKPITKYPCTICGRDFLLQSKLTTHMRTHEDQSLECKQCGRLLRGKYLLQKHVRVVHHRRYVYYCSSCGRGFEKQRCLREHRCGRRASDDQRQAGARTAGETGVVGNGPLSAAPAGSRCTKSKDACEAMLALSESSVKRKADEEERTRAGRHPRDGEPHRAPAAALASRAPPDDEEPSDPGQANGGEEEDDETLAADDSSGETIAAVASGSVGELPGDETVHGGRESTRNARTNPTSSAAAEATNAGAARKLAANGRTRDRTSNKWPCRTARADTTIRSPVSSQSTDGAVVAQIRPKRTRSQPTWLKAYNS